VEAVLGDQLDRRGVEAGALVGEDLDARSAGTGPQLPVERPLDAISPPEVGSGFCSSLRTVAQVNLRG
jgi:hypothetical protein